ncbi:hypothetical protein ABKN59_006681 [Abortiporus biennis]
MAFGLTIGTERANTLQNAIQDELMKRGFSPDADPVMAEYITIMIINNKTAAQITSELEDLIGPDFDASFVDWLFAEVAKSAPESESPRIAEPAPAPAPQPIPTRESPPHLQNDTSSASRRQSSNSRAPLYQQALSQAIPSAASNERKRTRSSSPGHVSKSRRVETVPTGPRAMFRGEGGSSGTGGGSRSLLERVGGTARNGGPHQPFVKDDIQARIDNITNANGPTPEMAMMMAGNPPPGFPMGMDMNAMAAGITNPLMLQEMMMNQMALMTQMAGAMGILNPAMMGAPPPGGFPMVPPGVQPGGDMSQFGGMGGHQDGRGRGRGRGGSIGRGGAGRGRPSNGHQQSLAATQPEANGSVLTSNEPAPSPAPTVVAPTPQPAVSTPLTASAPAFQPAKPSFVAPERPQSPTLCKFGLKCTNPLCRYSHPSPVATAESGVVLSNDPCEAGKNCKDKDCIKAHVSPSVLNPNAVAEHQKSSHFTPPPQQFSQLSQHNVPCRFAAACTRPGCPFLHPPSHPSNQAQTPCRFAAACTRANCPYMHPEGRVLPSTFHRGLSSNSPIVSVSAPETGSMGVSHHRSVTFNRTASSGTAKELQDKVKELEEKKSKAEAAMAQAKAKAAADKETTVNATAQISA